MHGKATRQNEPAGVRRGPPWPSGAVRRQLSLPRRPGPRQPRSSASGLPPGDAQRRCAPRTSPSLTRHNETTTAPWASPAQAGACWPPRRRQALLAPPPVPASLQSLALPSPPLRSSPQRQDAPGWDPGRGQQLFPRQGFGRRDHAAAGSAPSHRVRTLFQARLVLPLRGNPVPAAATTQNYPHRCWAAEKILQRWGRWGGDRCLAPCPPSKQQREFQTDTGVEGKRSGGSQYAI